MEKRKRNRRGTKEKQERNITAIEEEQKRNGRGTEDKQDRRGTEENSRNRRGIHRDFRVAIGREMGHDVVELLVSVQECPPDQAAS